MKPVLRWPGGKSRVASQIAALIPADIETYVEPFFGGGSVFFYLKEHNTHIKNWHVSDCYENLIDFYKIFSDEEVSKDKIKDLTYLCFISIPETREKLFKKIKEKAIKSSGKINAQQFFFLNRCSFSGTTEAGGFSKSAAMERFTLSSIERLKELPLVMSGVRIDCCDYGDTLYEYDATGALAYLDPPYYEASKLYGKNGKIHQEFDHDKFARYLRYIDLKWILSYDDCEWVWKTYKIYNIQKLDFTYGMSSKSIKKRASELIITNF